MSHTLAQCYMFVLAVFTDFQFAMLSLLPDFSEQALHYFIGINHY